MELLSIAEALTCPFTIKKTMPKTYPTNCASGECSSRLLACGQNGHALISNALRTGSPHLEGRVAETGEVLTEAQVMTLEKKQEDDVAHGEIETAHSSYRSSEDTFYVGTLKSVGCIVQQIFVDTYSKWAATKRYTTKTPITDA
jgi:hypothetical protein